jgi:hypothetical protein
MARGKTIVVLLLLAAGLGGFFYYDTYWLNPKREKAESAKGRIWTVEPKDVRASIARKARRSPEARRGRLGDARALRVRADRAAVDDMVTALATARMDREIDPNPAKPADFGLDPPEAEVRLEVKGGAAPLVLRVGGKNPTGVWVYAREGDKPAVVTMSESVARDTARPVADFRDRRVIAFDRRNLTGIDLEVAAPGSACRRRAWQGRILKPRPLRADAEMVADFLEKLKAKAIEFRRRAEVAGAAGLDKPSGSRWVCREKDRLPGPPGAPGAEKKGVYVKRDGEPGVILTAEALWTAFPRTVAALRDKVVVSYVPDKLAKLEITHGREAVVLEKEGAGWKLTAPELLKADTGAVTQLLWKIRDLRALGFLAEGAAEVPRYLSRPEVSVKLWETGAKEPKTLLLSRRRAPRRAARRGAAAGGPVAGGGGARGAHAGSPSCATDPARLRHRRHQKARVAGGDKPWSSRRA